MRVLVCGGRDYDDRDTAHTVIGALRSYHTIVHGGAPGADTLAGEVARDHIMNCEIHPADWRTHGRAAGPIRNQQMLDSGINLVIAFPGGCGTAHMVSIARAAGVPVLEVKP